MKHTKGPYHVVTLHSGDAMVCADSPKGRVELATIYRVAEHSPSDLPAVANADLFAAAPCLLSALKQLLTCSVGTDYTSVAEMAMAAQDARDAIKKAEGK